MTVILNGPEWAQTYEIPEGSRQESIDAAATRALQRATAPSQDTFAGYLAEVEASIVAALSEPTE